MQKRDGGRIYPVYGGGGATFKMDVFNREDRFVVARFGMSEGCTRFVTGKFFLNDSGLTVSPKNGALVQRFLDYQLLFKNDDIFALGKGAAQKNLDVSAFRGLSLFVPSKTEEQQRIVGILDEAFAGIATAKANAEKNLQNARAIFDDHLDFVFARRGDWWAEKRLEQIGRTQTGSTPMTADAENYGNFISFVKPGDFKSDGSLDYAKNGLSEQGLAGARKVAAGSVLMVCIGATIGKCGYCDRDITTNQQINALVPTDGSAYRFIYYQMLTESFQRRVIHASGQATLPIINKSRWSVLPLWLPPTVAEQKRIADKFDALSAETKHLESLYQRKLTALDDLKKSLLHQAFSGHL